MNSGLDIHSIGIALAAMLTITAACDPESGDLGLDERDEYSLRSGGGIWIGNGLPEPDVTGVNPSNGLASKHGLSPDGVLMADAAGILAATYLVECALSPEQSVTKTRKSDGQTFVLHGAIGLAPNWENGACNQDCQEWVSACLLARTNFSGESIGIWLSADHPAIGTGQTSDYPYYEASFYGNLFADADAKYLCRSNQALSGGQMSDHLQARTCDGEAPGVCGFTDWGGCNDDARCIFQNGEATQCGAGDPVGTRYRSISTFVTW